MVSSRVRSLCWFSLVVAVSVAGCSAGVSDEPESASEDDAIATEMPEPRGKPTRYPLVLEHGFNASTTNTWAFYKVKPALEADRQVVYLSEVPPFQGPEKRAEYLARVVDRVLAETGAPKVNLVAHSMGGLDVRVLVSSMGYGDRVASVTTISSPHRGSAVADVGLKLVKDGPVSDALDFLSRAFGKRITDDALAKDADLRAALEGLSEKNADGFNRRNPDDPRVFYQSWAGVSSRLGIGDNEDDGVCEGKLPKSSADVMDKQLQAGSLLVGHGFGFSRGFRPNDGMVTVESAKWGLFHGCVRADHLDEVGQPRHEGPSRRTGFDHLKFYRGIAFDLAERGF